MSGLELKALREQHQLTQDQLAKRLHLRRGAISVSDMEKGRRRIGQGYVVAIKLLFGLEPPLTKS